MKEDMNDPIEEEIVIVTTEESDEDEDVSTRGDIKISKKGLLIAGIIVLVALIGYHYRGLVIAATVNGSPITRFAVIQALEKAQGKAALDSLISQKLLDNEVRRKGVVVTQADITAKTKELSDSIVAQGSTLDEALASQNVTLAVLEENERTQLEAEKLLGDKIAVTDADIDKYIADGKFNIPKDKMEIARAQIKDQLKHDKLTTAVKALLDSLHSDAKINYIVQY